jgi:hypothetical protein
MPAAKKQYDMEELANQQADPKKIAEVITLAQEMYKLEREIGQDIIALKHKQDRYTALEMTILPEAMSAAAMASFALGESGWNIEVDDFVRGSIPSQSSIDEADGPDREALVNRRAAALKWLRLNKADSLIKNKLTAEFGKGQDKAAKEFTKQIEKAGYPAKCEESVNFQTLNKFLKEELEKGNEVPKDTFALYMGKRAKLTPPKRSRK